MTERFDIVGYARISVDDELDRDNVSIENQKAIITDYVKNRFPGSTLTFYEDRDRSGYTFEQREGYQAMRKELIRHQYDILVVKDFSRFSRRNSRGLVELEDLRDAGVRIISIGDGIDFPNDDDWLKIQFQFLINEMPVTDTSKKVRNVIKRRQADGKWICAAPYGYIVNKRKEFEIVPTEAETVRNIFDLYNNKGWGYKKIANYLTEQGIPTPRMATAIRKELAGEECKLKPKTAWSIVTIQEILDNDFYIGTFRQGKYTRAKINGKDIKRDEDEHIVIENHHQAIIDYRTFATTRALREKRSTSNYRGNKKYSNDYTGFLVCGDCGNPMFSMSRSDLKPAYICGNYQRRGLAGCTSHHIRVDKLDELVKIYIRKLMDNSSEILEKLNEELENENDDIAETENSADNLSEVLDSLYEELKITKRQRVRDILKHPEQEELLSQTYDEMEEELQNKIKGLLHQIEMLSDKRNTIIQVNRTAKTAVEIFEDILKKEKLERNDLELLIDQIKVYENRIELKLKPDIDSILRCNTLDDREWTEEEIEELLRETIVQTAKNRKNREFSIDVICDGDPLEIFTDNDGEVIFKKYSPIGELANFSAQYAEVLYKVGGFPVIVCDRDSVVTAAGIPKKEVLERRVTPMLEDLMERRAVYGRSGDSGETLLFPIEGIDKAALAAAAIISAGDVCGAVVCFGEGREKATDAEIKLITAAANFLGKQMEE